MSRLHDRILANGCRPFRPYHVFPPEREGASHEERRARLAADIAADPSLREQIADPVVREQTIDFVVSHRESGPVATRTLDASEIEGVPVIAAEEVARYCHELEKFDMADIVTNLAPPFDRFFVEFQGVPNLYGLNAWGVLVSDATEAVAGGPTAEFGWHLWLDLIIERNKNKPIGPVAHHVMGLARDGSWFIRPEDGRPMNAALLVDMTAEPPRDVVVETMMGLNNLFLPALFAISLMHCRNVAAREIEPNERRSRRWEKRRGRPLVRYHVLDITPARRLLTEHGDVERGGIAQALHLCRGHFKTFGEDAPLFGRHIGTYWWADHVRGKAELGVVDKDYRIEPGRADALGAGYIRADENPELEQAGEARQGDPDAAGRGLGAHNRTQNLLADAVIHAGLSPRSPAGGEPKYDLAWERDGAIWVAEVKSLTPKNEEYQLRLALGQVSRYRHQLARIGMTVHAVIASERMPTDDTWLDVTAEHGVLLAWPEQFDDLARAQPHDD